MNLYDESGHGDGVVYILLRGTLVEDFPLFSFIKKETVGWHRHVYRQIREDTYTRKKGENTSSSEMGWEKKIKNHTHTYT